MLSVVLAAIGALVYGSADFLGGVAARRMRVLPAVAIAAASGFVALLIATPLVGFTLSPTDLAWGALSGVFGALSILLLYACLAIGPMSILSPLTAVVSAVGPILWGLTVGGETFPVTGYVGLALALVAVVLVGVVREENAARPTARGLFLAVGAGLAVGGLLICLDQAGSDGGLVPLAAGRAVNAAITGGVLLAVVLMGRRRGGTSVPASGAARRRAAMIAVACGLTDVVANVLLLLALRSGDLSIVSALTALYPAGTILLAALVLRERVSAVQWVGLALALAAGALLGAA